MLDRPLPGPKHLQRRVDPPQVGEMFLVITVNVGEALEAVEVNVAAVAEVTVKVNIKVTVVKVSVIEVGVARAGLCA